MSRVIQRALAFMLVGLLTVGTTAAQERGAMPMSSAGTPLHHLLEVAAIQAHLKIWILPSTPDTPQRGDVLGGGSPRQVFDRLLSLNKLEAHDHNGVLVIGPSQAIDARFGLSTTKSQMFPVVGLDPNEVKTTLEPLLPPGTIVLVDAPQHSLYVSGSQSAINQVKAFLQPLEQGYVDVRTLDIESNLPPADIVAEISKAVPPVGPESIQVDPHTGKLIVAGPPGYHQQVKDALALIDHDAAQVAYDVQIVEADPAQVSIDRGFTIGQAQSQIQAAGAAAIVQPIPPVAGRGIFTFPLNQTPSLAIELDALEQRGHAKFIRQQTITATSGTQSKTSFTDQVPFPVVNQFSGVQSLQTISVGVTIALTPQVGKKSIATEAYIEYSTEDGTGALGAPIVVGRTAEVRASTPDGQSFLLVGERAEDATDTVTGLPVLSNLPVIGGLFRRHRILANKQEILAVVTPHILSGPNRVDASKYPNASQLLSTPSPSATPGGH